MSKENKCSRFKKSKKQIDTLNDFYQKQQIWGQNTIKEIANLTNLPKEKIYKWYWDQNKKFRQELPSDEIEGEIIVKQDHLSSNTHEILYCSGLQLNQELDENLKNRLIKLARDLILIK
ncbi:unnamed protein product [Paramecium primaurelia]|uniref:Homeobox domain-containing protein n=2 Tax=Paramecium TaxID=5884 RepID=A0A8S1TXP5_9CILI|nr:unnamed protein product [Paramecium primaurelia]CAD8156990.1 unnamed protein product [Paramecium pentaurelia]